MQSFSYDDGWRKEALYELSLGTGRTIEIRVIEERFSGATHDYVSVRAPRNCEYVMDALDNTNFVVAQDLQVSGLPQDMGKQISFKLRDKKEIFAFLDVLREGYSYSYEGEIVDVKFAEARRQGISAGELGLLSNSFNVASSTDDAKTAPVVVQRIDFIDPCFSVKSLIETRSGNDVATYIVRNNAVVNADNLSKLGWTVEKTDQFGPGTLRVKGHIDMVCSSLSKLGAITAGASEYLLLESLEHKRQPVAPKI